MCWKKEKVDVLALCVWEATGHFKRRSVKLIILLILSYNVIELCVSMEYAKVTEFVLFCMKKLYKEYGK